MLYAQEPRRMSSTQVNFKLSDESRSSGVSALVSRLNSSNPGAGDTDNEKSRREPNKTKEQKMQDTFPWISGFTSLCQATVGCRNMKALECLMKKYIEIVTPSVIDCYSKANRASKLKKNMKDILIFFHLYYQEIKEALEGSSYLDLMMPLVSMFIDMEIKASIRGKESLKKLASRLTSSLYLFLDNSEEHMLDAILMTKNVNKNYQEICNPLLWKILNSISYRKDAIFYVRCLLTFKLWRKIVPDPEERNRINKRALQKLHAPPNLLEQVKALGNVLPRIPKTKKNITLFLLQSNFNLKDACREFLKSVKKTQKSLYNQSLGNVEIDKQFFFISDSGSCAHLLSEKDVEVDKSHNSMDIWSSISTVSIASPSDKLKELSSDQTMGVQMTVGSKKKRKLGKKVKKGKKKGKGSSGTKAKKKKKLKNSESARFEKGNKKASKLKAKKKKKKKLHQLDESSPVKQSIPQGCESNQIKVKQISSQIEEVNQMTVKSSSPLLIEDVVQSNDKSSLPLFEQGTQVNVKVVLAEPEESLSAKLALAVPQILEESTGEKTVEEPMNNDQDMKIQSSSEMKNCELVVEDPFILGKDQIKLEDNGRPLEIPETIKDQLDTSFENSKSELFGGKSKDLFDKEFKVLVDHPKTESMETSLSSPKQISEATRASEVDETLGKKEKAEVVSMVSEAFQSDLNARMSSQIKEQVTVHQVSSISIKKMKSKAPEGKPNKLSDKSILTDDLLTKTDGKVDQSDVAHEDSMANLFTIEKTKNESSEGEIHLNLPKSEKLENLPSSTKSPSSPILEISTSRKVDELLVKKEKVEVISNVFVGSVGSQFDVKDIMNTERERTDQVAGTQIHTITFGEKVTEAYECAKSFVLSDVPVPISDDSVSKHDNKDKADVTFDNQSQRSNLLIVEKSKDELNKKVKNRNVLISLVVEERGDSNYEKTKVTENAVSDPMYSMDMEKTTSSMEEKCDDSESIETSAVTKTSHINSDSEVEILEVHKETGKRSASSSEEEIVLSDEGEQITHQQSLVNILNTGKLDVVVNTIDESQYTLHPKIVSVDAGKTIEPKQEHTSELMDAFYPQSPVDSFYSKTFDKDGLCLGNSLDNSPSLHWECKNGTEHPLQLPLEVKEICEGSPKLFEASTPKTGMEKVSYPDVISHKRSQKELDNSSHDWNSSQTLPTIASESGTVGSNSPCGESGMDSGEVVGQDTENCDTVDHFIPCDRSSVSSLKFYNAQTYMKASELTPHSKEAFLSHNNYVPKVDNCHLGYAPLRENVGESAVNKLSGRDISRLKVSSLVPVNISESDPTSVELSSSRRTKLHYDERIPSQMAASKQVTENVSVVQAEGQALNIPIISCPTIPGDAITHETPLKTDRSKDRCNCDECSVGSLKVSASSVDSRREGLLLKKMNSSSKFPHDDRVGSLIEGKEGAGEISMGQGRPSVRGTLSESNIPGKSSHYSDEIFSIGCNAMPYTQNTATSSITPNIPSLSYPYTSPGVTPTQRCPQLKSALDFVGWNCTLSDCTHLSSSDSKEYPYIPKPSNYGTPNNCKSPNENFSEKELEDLKSMSDNLIPKTENEWKSSNEKLLEKIEESLKNTKYDLNSETSLPLKKRLKKAAISYESAENIIVSKPKTSLVSFPSYPTTPMMSLAHIDFKENVFVRAWTKSKPSLEEGRVVDHEICSAMNCPNPLYISNQSTLSMQTSSYATNLVKGIQRNSAHCGKCAEEAVCSVCDSAFYNIASSAEPVNPSSSVATYSCASSPSTKVNVSSFNAQPTLNSQYYSVSSSGQYGIQQTTPVDCTSCFKLENAQCEIESESKSNQSLSKSDNNYDSIIGLSYLDREIFVWHDNGAYVADPDLTQLSLILNSASDHVEKQGKSRVEEIPEQNQEHEEMELGNDIEVGGEVEVGGEIEVGEELEVGEEVEVGEETEGDAEAEVEGDEGRETPKYSIVQKSSPDSEEDANKETTRIMPFKIFLTKNKNHKELAKNSCSKCRMVDCKGDCHSSSSEVDGSLANSDHENNDNVSEPKSHRRRGRKSRSSRDGEECVRKSKRRKHPHPLEDSEFEMHYDKKRRRKHVSM